MEEVHLLEKQEPGKPGQERKKLVLERPVLGKRNLVPERQALAQESRVLARESLARENLGPESLGPVLVQERQVLAQESLVQEGAVLEPAQERDLVQDVQEVRLHLAHQMLEEAAALLVVVRVVRAARLARNPLRLPLVDCTGEFLHPLPLELG